MSDALEVLDQVGKWKASGKGVAVATVITTWGSSPRPVGSHKLSRTKHDWRIRLGNYRVIYEIADSIKIVRVYRIRHRREAYR